MPEARIVGGVVLAAAAGGLVYLLAPILTPFLAGALLAYIADPLVDRLEGWRIPRAAAVVLIFILSIAAVLGALFFLVPGAQRQLAAFAAKAPQYLEWLRQNLLPRLETLLGRPIALDPETLRQSVTAHWQEVGDWLGAALAGAKLSGLKLLGWLVNLILIPIVTFYLLLDWDRIGARAVALFPAPLRAHARRLARETDEVLGSFLRGQLTVMLCLAVLYSVGLWAIGLDLALPIGLLAGLVSFVPYLGFLTGVIAAGIAAYLQFHDAMYLVWVLAVFLAGQVLDGLLLTPRLVGGRIGLHPVAVIFAVMAGGQLFGFLGVLLALPAAAALKVWLRHAHESLIGAAPAPPAKRRPRRAPP